MNLRSGKVMLFVVIGAIYWLMALLTVRLAGDAIFERDNPLYVVMYLTAPIVTALAAVIAAQVARLPLNEMVIPVYIMTATALLLDGLAIGITPRWYGPTDTQTMLGGAWIMWGAGVGMVMGWLLSLRGTTASHTAARGLQMVNTKSGHG